MFDVQDGSKVYQTDMPGASWDNGTTVVVWWSVVWMVDITTGHALTENP